MPVLTEEYARKATLPTNGQKLVFDDKLRGFGLRLTKTARSWIAELHQNRRSVRVTLGRVGELPLADARKMAIKAKLDGVADLRRKKGMPATVSDLWTRLVREDEHRLRPRTKKLYDGYWRVHLEPALGRLALLAVTPDDVSTMLAKIPGAANANRVHEVTKRMFSYAVDHKWLGDNPALTWKRRHEDKRATYLDAAALGSLFGALPVNAVGDALRFAALTGARIGEVLSLKKENLREADSVWTKPASTTKQKKAHIVPLSDEAMALVARQPKRGPFVFSREDGQAIKTARKTWLWAVKRAGLKDVRIHDLRHSLASAMVNSGASLALVGAALGHSTPATTQRYAHVANAALREALNKVGSNVIPLNPDKRVRKTA